MSRDWVYVEPERVPVTTLIDPGAQPHEVRFYQPAVGTAETGTALYTLEFSLVVDGFTATELSSETSITGTILVVEVTDEGIVTTTTFDEVSFTGSDPDAEAAAEAFLAELAKRVELTVTQLTDPTGALLATESFEELAGGFSADLFNLFCSSPLPAEPFGVGAVWETVSLLESDGVEVTETATVTVTDLQGPLITVAVEVEQQLGAAGFIPSGQERLEDAMMTSSGSGQAVLNLEGPAPVMEWTSIINQVVNATVTAQGQTVDLVQTTNRTVQVNRE